jgi:hypothetical protein
MVIEFKDVDNVSNRNGTTHEPNNDTKTEVSRTHIRSIQYEEVNLHLQINHHLLQIFLTKLTTKLSSSNISLFVCTTSQVGHGISKSNGTLIRTTNQRLGKEGDYWSDTWDFVSSWQALSNWRRLVECSWQSWRHWQEVRRKYSRRQMYVVHSHRNRDSELITATAAQTVLWPGPRCQQNY